MLQVWTMKLTESINICYISVKVACTTKANMKETFTGNEGSCKCLCDKWTAAGE